MIHETCGDETTQGQVCSSCGEVLHAEDMTRVKPWKNARDTLVAVGTLAASVELVAPREGQRPR